MTIESAVRATLVGGSAVRTISWRSFYLAMAALLLLLVLLGFGRTLYLRGFFAVPPIAPSVWLHGIVLTGWFAGFALQAGLVATRCVDAHRRIGWGLLGIAVAVVATSTSLTFGVVPAMRASGLASAVVAVAAPVIFWGNLAAAATFGVLVLAAVALRRNAEAHKRLMLLASTSIIAPALARIAQWPVLGPLLNAQFVVLAVVASFLLVGVLLIYDLVTRRRPHPATLAGGAFLVAAKLVAVLAIAQSGLGRSLVPGLG